MSDYVLELIKQELLREDPLSALDDLPVGTYETLRECKHKIEQQAEEIQRLKEIHISHEACDAFWECWRENGETHKHGYYESTRMAVAAYMHSLAQQEQSK